MATYLSKAEVVASEQAKTQNPMYEIWSQALRTRDNNVVNAIVPNASSNPENVKRAERVLYQSFIIIHVCIICNY